jgi:putative nucleotidyltransferase with HDIG domain
MRRALRLYILGVVFAGAGALAAAIALFQIDGAIALPLPGLADRDATLSVAAGVAFWTGLTLVAWALPVRIGRGSTVAVSLAPILAALSLGGPTAGAVVAVIGTTELRELRGRIPWYGSLTNHAAIALPALIGGVIIHLVGRASIEQGFLGLMLGATAYVALNVCLVSMLVALRTERPFRALLLVNLVEFMPNQLALAPLAWLIAVAYPVAWWSSLLLGPPLATTRLAYLRLVEMRDMFTQTISTLAQAIDKRDKFTSGHSLRVKEIAVDIGRELRLGEADLEALEWGGLLHDVGKIGVPDAVLLKQERLTRGERAVMNAHPVLGAEIIAPVKRLARELPLIRHHHEWYNGSGYPDRLIGDEIPRLARVLHVADAFEAMTAARPYRMTALSTAQAVAELRKYTGIQFDPVVVDAFVRTKWAAGTEDYSPPERVPRSVPLLGQAAPRIASASSAPSPAREIAAGSSSRV